MRPIRLPPNPRVLTITLRRLGDVLLTTPLIRSLKRALPQASIDAMVFAGTEGILSGNPDLNDVIAIPQRPSIAEAAGILRRVWRRYDLAMPTQIGDRPDFFAWAAGRRRVGLFEDSDSGRWWKRRVLDQPVICNWSNHRVTEMLRLADAIGVPRRDEIVCPQDPNAAAKALPGPYAVLHAAPMYRIRRWTDAGWRALARALTERGLIVAVTGGPGPAEKDYLDCVWRGLDPPVVRLDGALHWPELALLLRNAAVFVGPETSVTHLAAAAGAPTVALYGPATPTEMGPWPIGGLQPQWSPAGTIQHRGNVWLVQNPLPCMPCNKLGCEGHIESYSRCLDELPVQQVLRAVDRALATQKAA
jgi:lipopolysaccharide heptosyltransferase III